MLSFFTNIFSFIGTTIAMLIIGAFMGVGCYFIARFIGGVSGLLAAAAIGAFMLLGLHWSDAISSLSNKASEQKIADLKAQNELLELEIKRKNAVDLFTAGLITEMQTQIENRDKQYQEVLSLIDKHKDDKDCISSEELKAIGEMQ